jgi:hypothetical protein
MLCSAEGDNVPLTQKNAKQNLSILLAKFTRELAANKIRDYNEEAAKTAFIQPLLKGFFRHSCG